MYFDPPPLTHAFDLRVELDPIMEMGPGRAGQRRIIPIIGGTVTGERIRGEVLNLGADWQTIFEGGLAELDTRYAMRTHDGAVIEIINFGLRHGPPEVMARVAAGEDVDPAEYYMRTHCRLETGDPRYAWVNRQLFIGIGGRRATRVEISVYELS
ncbi:DUF3237 domain-containing protein [Vannielia litorea]|uniref:DUF3237 domain-containing protein n=1 Tax=Vannielia litorea TaxID=1217970 RepID=UPI001C98A5F2|nr:DUF3237 domain-containing protein [Vannielia litorea]MBY6151608.1 DUF3237 domain-containing protein [Vannielia litorea]